MLQCALKFYENKTEDPSVLYAGQGYVTQKIHQVTLRNLEEPCKKEPRGTLRNLKKPQGTLRDLKDSWGTLRNPREL